MRRNIAEVFRRIRRTAVGRRAQAVPGFSSDIDSEIGGCSSYNVLNVKVEHRGGQVLF